MARSATKRVSVPTKTVKTNAFPVFKMKVPDEMLAFKRTSYGWEDLKKKGDAKLIPRSLSETAKSSAHSFASAHDFKIRTMAQTNDETGEVIRETVYFDKEGKEVSLDSIPSEIMDDAEKLAKTYTMKELAANFIIVRISNPGDDLAKVEGGD